MKSLARTAVAASCVAAAASSACAECPRDFRGIHDGDTLKTTIASLDSSMASSLGPSCGALGDLQAGAVLTTAASVTQGSPGDGCFNSLSLAPRALTTGSFEAAQGGGTTLRLPSGCTGDYAVYFQSSDPSSSFLDNSPTSLGPPWRLVRRFQTTADPSPCFPGVTPPLLCTDAFVGQNVRE